VFRIRHAARLAGINPTLLRAWERRYHLVAPQRTDAGYRVYSEADIDLLKAAARLVEAGHTISEVARLPRDKLLAASQQLGPPPEAGAHVGETSTSKQARDEEAEALDSDAAIDAALAGAMRAVGAFDRAQFEAALFPLTTLAAMPPVSLCERVLLPLLGLIGDGWERGQLTVAAEHFGSALCRTKILQCLEFLARASTGPRVVCACPENELHEGGLLAFAVRAAAAHHQVIYLGPHTPLAQAIETATRIEAELVALSLIVTRAEHEMTSLLKTVREGMKRHPRLRLLAGGREALIWRADLEAAGVEVADRISVALPPSSGSVPEKRHRR
jgi:MerR family transcriptional regulator, light-induced transcriptional regulator